MGSTSGLPRKPHHDRTTIIPVGKSRDLVGRWRYLSAIIQGFESPQKQSLHIKGLYQVKRPDLKRMVEKFMGVFLEAENRVTVLTTVAGNASDVILEQFKGSDTDGMEGEKDEDIRVMFKKMELKDLSIPSL
jgi:hypothetical protein